MPLIISDTDGRLLYKSRSVKTDGVLRVWKRLASKVTREGLIASAGRSYYVKEVPLLGKKYLFFMDFACVKDAADEVFDFRKMAQEKREVPLSWLVELFADTYLQKLYSDGVRVSVGALACDTAVCVSPSAFVLSLAIIARLTADSGRVVTFSFASECGRVTVFSDGCGSERISPESREVLEVLLYEVASAAGFAVEKTVSGGKERLSLVLAPLDIALLGFKTERGGKTEMLCMCYELMFL